jgi:hypothetical protein
VQTIHPTSSYQIDLPDDFVTEDDYQVSSYWVPDSPLVLQLSSYQRPEDEQVSARTLLADATSSNPRRPVERNLHESQFVDVAAAEESDADGNRWIHACLLWPHLLIYVTLIGPESLDWDADNWAFVAIRTIAPTIH